MLRPPRFRTVAHRLALRVEGLRLARRIRDLAELVDVPHDIADSARTRIARLARRRRALTRLIG